MKINEITQPLMEASDVTQVNSEVGLMFGLTGADPAAITSAEDVVPLLKATGKVDAKSLNNIAAKISNAYSAEMFGSFAELGRTVAANPRGVVLANQYAWVANETMGAKTPADVIYADKPQGIDGISVKANKATRIGSPTLRHFGLDPGEGGGKDLFRQVSGDDQSYNEWKSVIIRTMLDEAKKAGKSIPSTLIKSTGKIKQDLNNRIEYTPGEGWTAYFTVTGNKSGAIPLGDNADAIVKAALSDTAIGGTVNWQAPFGRYMSVNFAKFKQYSDKFYRSFEENAAKIMRETLSKNSDTVNNVCALRKELGYYYTSPTDGAWYFVPPIDEESTIVFKDIRTKTGKGPGVSFEIMFGPKGNAEAKTVLEVNLYVTSTFWWVSPPTGILSVSKSKTDLEVLGWQKVATFPLPSAPKKKAQPLPKPEPAAVPEPEPEATTTEPEPTATTQPDSSDLERVTELAFYKK